ncbi:MAG TPA: hypothetical protein VFU82_03780 [Gammaproteobacteria bacterium]|jgi:hypothetical protein|nr:hypothetical protein [Gammaproteobacteria bacterium]
MTKLASGFKRWPVFFEAEFVAGLIENLRILSGGLCDTLGFLEEACTPYQHSDFLRLCL